MLSPNSHRNRVTKYTNKRSDEGLTLLTSAPYTTYGDDHKPFNHELSKLQFL